MVTCHQTDYVEIACMYRYPIKLTMRSGKEVLGTALDTKWDENKQECIEIKTEDASAELIALEDISALEVLIDNPHFSKITFD
ncbi:Rho-binding antiterminator [Photobacterium rosenbergii]|uniref:Rho-binding antiterminator n=1 Tax=Photobacterium rosenbergii TaxID=294936 RepID=A0ABU3ZD90_9GAMM|nr:Rho-binding antiterminator [Photobacterium rosenbergii]MDV5168082.1 Rho-binding antiterminator [Photobacterium rosenbergii]